MELSARGIVVGYGSRKVLDGVDLEAAGGTFTAVVGPNACGKSTLLRALARGLRPQEGAVLLDGRDVAGLGARDLARRLGLLPQSAVAPDGITARELVSRGRYPHQGAFRPWSRQDEEAVTEAMRETGTAAMADRPVDELSGGQRQRVWLALVLAQRTPVVLLDEPTTFLDIAHQVTLLDLCARMARRGRTIVAVLHDLNQACRYADRLIALRDGRVVADGAPAAVVTEHLVEEVFDLRCRILVDPETDSPLVVPLRPAVD